MLYFTDPAEACKQLALWTKMNYKDILPKEAIAALDAIIEAAGYQLACNEDIPENKELWSSWTESTAQAKLGLDQIWKKSEGLTFFEGL